MEDDAQVTLSEAARLLQCDRQTLGRWLDRARISPRNASDNAPDRRGKYLEYREVVSLAAAHGRELVDVDALPRTLAAAHAEIVRLRAALARAEQAYTHNRPYNALGRDSDGLTRETIDRTSQPRKAPRIGARRASIDGVVSVRAAARLAVAHGAASEAAARDWLREYAPLASVDQVVTLVRDRLATHRAGVWHTCDDAACPCQTL